MLIDTKSTFDTFVAFHREMEPLISSWSRRHWVANLPEEDIHSEMLAELWQTWTRWNSNTYEMPIAQLFWARWQHRRINILRDYKTIKRSAEVLHKAPSENVPGRSIGVVGYIPPWPSWFGERDRKIWVLIALGFTGREISEVIDISRTGVYFVLGRWREAGHKALGFDVPPPREPVDTCARGHRRDEHSYWFIQKNGKRMPVCRPCHNDRARERRGTGTYGG